MPSRILPSGTRGETPTASTLLPNPPSNSKDETSSLLSSTPQDKSGTESLGNQSSLNLRRDHPSSTTEESTTSNKSAIAGSLESTPDSRQRTRSSPSPLQSVSSPLSLLVGSYFAAQPGASGLEPRSPVSRRPPASRSCHGVETFSGPPPAFTTRGSYQGESTGKFPQPVTSTPSANRDTTVNSIDALVLGTPSKTDEPTHPPLERSPSQNLPSMSRMAPASNDHHFEEDQDEATLRGADFPQLTFAAAHKNRQAIGELRPSQEDLFLNLAQGDSPEQTGTEPSSQKHQRRSRVSLSSAQPPLSYRPSSAQRPDSSGKDVTKQRPASNREHATGSWAFSQTFSTNSPDSNSNNASRENTNPATKYHENSRYYPPRTSFNPSRARRSSTRDPSPDSSIAPDRRQYITASPGPPIPAYRQTLPLYQMNDQFNSSPLNGYPNTGLQSSARRASRAGGTESSVSTTAPSTVWDELETLKSRINNLERTGKLPSVSGPANTNGSGQRPATAGTTMTTLSSSPNHGRLKNGSLEVSPDKAAASKGSHPLLHSALERSKGLVTTDVYRSLEITALDALALVEMTGSSQELSDTTNSATDGLGPLDRRLRRKADDMCRSLTELCIALSDVKPDSETLKTRSRPESRDTATNGQAVAEDSYSIRATSIEPDASRASSRAMSRFEARRASMQALNSSLSRRGSSPSEPAATPTQHQPQLITTSRAPSVLIRRRTDDGERPLSRAITEAGQANQRPSPREYTSQHPLPSHPQRSPSVQSSIPQRKSYFTNPNYSPTTPNVQASSRRYLENSTPPSSGSLRQAQVRRQQRLASLEPDSGGRQQREGFFSRRTRPVELGPGS